MGNIVLLDDLTINKIAAGEVIERPASVIKEMVENSIDAGATNITVEIKNGGISYIKVTDNGKGISEDDLEIAFERHATSKIRTADDLNTVTSMGFRGEALASIAAIANVEMASKTEEQETGYKVVVEAGCILSKEEIGCKTGTSITVRNLFFNTPVRYKFLKKDYTESGYIEDVITRIALVNPNIAIKLINTGKTVIQTNGNGDFKSVIYSIYGKDIASGIIEVSYKYEDIKITGVIGKPEISRSNRSNQIFFVNKRYIKDKTLTSATEQAYKGLIPIGKFGFVVLNLQMDPSKVDVNVHPAKLEVRFQEENKIFQSIYHAIKDSLLKGDLTANTENKINEEISSNYNTQVFNIEEHLKKLEQEYKENEANGLFSFRKQNTEQIEKYTEKESKIKTNTLEDNIQNQDDKEDYQYVPKAIQELRMNNKERAEDPIDTSDVLSQLKQINEKIAKDLEKTKDEQLNENQAEYNLESGNKNETKNENETKDENEIKDENKILNIDNQYQEDSEDFNKMYAKLFGIPPITETKKNEKEQEKLSAVDIVKDNVSIFEGQEEFKRPSYQFIGIIFKTYIILEIEQEMYILDQHAAHERIMYEKIKENYYSENTKDSQLLLLPDIITLTHKEMEIAKENIKMFEQAGFSLEEFGVPTICLDLDTKDLFLETLDEINTVARTAKQEKEEKFIATVACKAAVKANMALSKEEVESLMNDLLKLPNPFSCPHGRPTVIKMTKYDIERKFARK